LKWRFPFKCSFLCGLAEFILYYELSPLSCSQRIIICTHLKIFLKFGMSEIFSTLSLKIPLNLFSMCDILCVFQVSKHNIKIKRPDWNRIPKGFQTRTCGKRNLGKSLKQGSILKNVVFWNVALLRSCNNRRFGGIYRLHLQGRRIHERGTSVSRWLQAEPPVGNNQLYKNKKREKVGSVITQ
jgi:hypothetical protein